MAEENHVDSATVDMLVEILEDGFPTLVETFIADSRLRISEIRAGLEKGDADAVRRSAHSLKGSSSNVGAGVLTELSQQLEVAARDGQLQGQEETLASLEAEFLAVEKILSDKLTTV